MSLSKMHRDPRAPVGEDGTCATFSGTAGLTEHDRREVAAFKRFLSLGVRPDDAHRIPREFPGWLPYVLGHFFEAGGPGQPLALLAPPEGFDAVPMTAWTVPS